MSTSQQKPSEPRWRNRTVWARDRSAPLRAFLVTESGSAVLLVAGIAVALVWANVHDKSYESFWSTTFSIQLGGVGISQDLREWVNRGLMTFFFLVVGLEARREFDLGDLRERRRFVLPLVAGLAGMAVPIGIYLAINAGRPSAHGWGVAMSTDTALALGLLALLGRDIPDRMRVFVLTVFVVDDLVALAVIALVYSEDISFASLVPALVAFVLLLVAVRLRLQRRLVYIGLGVVLWAALSSSGIDPVVAGLVIGLAAPAYTPTRERPARGHRVGPQVPRGTDARARPVGPGRSDGRAIAERAAAGLLPPVDQLRHRADLRAGQRGPRPRPRLPRRGVRLRDHAGHHPRLRRRQTRGCGRRVLGGHPAQPRSDPSTHRQRRGARQRHHRRHRLHRRAADRVTGIQR